MRHTAVHWAHELNTNIDMNKLIHLLKSRGGADATQSDQVVFKIFILKEELDLHTQG